MSYLDREELEGLGFAALGENVLISAKASIYGAGRISIGSNVRIDDFCILSAGEGGIRLGNYIHIAAAATLIGQATIELEDFANLSGRVSVYSSSDDYSGKSMTNPMVPEEFKQVDTRPVKIGRHVIIGCAAVVLPGTLLDEGCAVGALSLVSGRWAPFTMLAGSPARKIAKRDRSLLELEAEFLAGLRTDTR